MSRYVVDVSVAIKWFISAVHSEAALRLCRSQIRLHVPAFVTLELGNIIVRKIRRGELTPAEGEAVIGELKQLPLQQHADARLFPAAYQFAVDTQRSLYDCLYLALAEAIDGVLVTADRKFHAAVAKSVYE